MKTTLLVCETCGFDASNPDAVRPGKRLAQSLKQRLTQLQQETDKQPGIEGLQVEGYTCLMACQQKCNVQLRENNKIGYALGQMQPDSESVEALLMYSLLYRASDTGAVPYKQWPAHIKGKFIARFPPLEAPATDS